MHQRFTATTTAQVLLLWQLYFGGATGRALDQQVCHWRSFENLSTFAKVVIKSQVCCCFLRQRINVARLMNWCPQPNILGMPMWCPSRPTVQAHSQPTIWGQPDFWEGGPRVDIPIPLTHANRQWYTHNVLSFNYFTWLVIMYNYLIKTHLLLPTDNWTKQ